GRMLFRSQGTSQVIVEDRGRLPEQQAQLPTTPSPGGSEGRLRGPRPLRRSGRIGRQQIREEGPGEPESQHGAHEVAAARLPVCDTAHPRAPLLFLQRHGSPLLWPSAVTLPTTPAHALPDAGLGGARRRQRRLSPDSHTTLLQNTDEISIL